MRFDGFKVEDKETGAYAFFDVVVDEDVPCLSFSFGTADPMEMDFESLGKIIALAKWKTIPIWEMATKNDGGYRTMLTESIEISHIDSESFFELMEDDVVVDFKRYDVLMSNSDFKHQKTVEKW